MTYNFPTLGELVKFAFDSAGVLPRKRGDDDGLSEADKKRIQKQIERLTDEEGSLTERCDELIRTLAFLTAGAISSPKANFVVGECAMDLFDVYNSIIRDEGTYLTEKDSILWFCRVHAVPCLALSIGKHILRFNLASEGFNAPPDRDWYLPTITGDEIRWPLEKAMSWVYESCDTSRTHFHYPGKSVEADHPEQQQNLDNASAWFNGKRIPSWPSLYWNFSRSLERLQNHHDPVHQRLIPEKLRASIYQVLFLARLSTHVCQVLKDSYGIATLAEIVAQFKRHRDWLSVELAQFHSETTAYIEDKQVPPIAIDDVWWEFSERYWAWYSNRCAELLPMLGILFEDHGDASRPAGVVTQLIERFGEHPVRSLLEHSKISCEFSMPSNFPERLWEGFDLKKADRRCCAEDIDQYRLHIQQDGLASHLCWMEYWLRAVVNYRKEEYELAFCDAEMAFEHAKYRAGRNQYDLVNLYVELAAKTDRWKSFKKGVDWARYLGIQVRWLRDKSPTDEALNFVFTTMRLARYNH